MQLQQSPLTPALLRTGPGTKPILKKKEKREQVLYDPEEDRR